MVSSMNYGYILTINNIPIREIPLRFNKYSKKWIADENVNKIKIFKTNKNAIDSLDWLKEKSKRDIDMFEFDINEVKVNKVKLIIEDE